LEPAWRINSLWPGKEAVICLGSIKKGTSKPIKSRDRKYLIFIRPGIRGFIKPLIPKVPEDRNSRKRKESYVLPLLNGFRILKTERKY
jgi:hypothetical protein